MSNYFDPYIDLYRFVIMSKEEVPTDSVLDFSRYEKGFFSCSSGANAAIYAGCSYYSDMFQERNGKVGILVKLINTKVLLSLDDLVYFAARLDRNRESHVVTRLLREREYIVSSRSITYMPYCDTSLKGEIVSVFEDLNTLLDKQHPEGYRNSKYKS